MLGVFDALLCNHFDEVPGAVGGDVGAARHAVDVRGDLLSQRGPSGLVGLAPRPRRQ